MEKHPVPEGGWYQQGHVAKTSFFIRRNVTLIFFTNIPMDGQLPEGIHQTEQDDDNDGEGRGIMNDIRRIQIFWIINDITRGISIAIRKEVAAQPRSTEFPATCWRVWLTKNCDFLRTSSLFRWEHILIGQNQNRYSYRYVYNILGYGLKFINLLIVWLIYWTSAQSNFCIIFVIIIKKYSLSMMQALWNNRFSTSR